MMLTRASCHQAVARWVTGMPYPVSVSQTAGLFLFVMVQADWVKQQFSTVQASWSCLGTAADEALLKTLHVMQKEREAGAVAGLRPCPVPLGPALPLRDHTGGAAPPAFCLLHPLLQ